LTVRETGTCISRAVWLAWFSAEIPKRLAKLGVIGIVVVCIRGRFCTSAGPSTPEEAAMSDSWDAGWTGNAGACRTADWDCVTVSLVGSFLPGSVTLADWDRITLPLASSKRQIRLTCR
jgi:hypothetical protein